MLKKSFSVIATTLIFLAIGSASAQNLVNPNATPEAVKLKVFLDSVKAQGKILSGQAYESVTEKWNERIESASGQLPAILSHDFMNSMPWRVSQGADPEATTRVAIDWAQNKGGLVEMHWHWDAPKDTKFSTWQGFYTKNTTFDLTYALSDTTTEDYKLLIRDMDIVADLLKIFQDSAVPVLWRPLHEAEGKWFWWGAGKGNSGESCKKLWRIMYDRFVNYHQINNLIWVWNSYGTSKENWYPGDDMVDIIAWDYPDYKANGGSWSQYQQLFGNKNKLFAVGEDGTLINPDLLSTQNWLYFITWAYMIKDPSQTNGKNTAAWINQVFNDPRVITLDDLQTGPKAKAGKAQIIFDYDGDGIERVQLDGSASSTDTGFITGYLWTEFDLEVAQGVTPTVDFSLGVHNVTLTINTSVGLSDSEKIRIEVKTPSITLNKSFEVSSTEAGFGNKAEFAVDGNIATRWSSQYSDPQWYTVDLGKPYDIKTVVLHWEAASAKNYRIDESNDNQNWTTVISKENMPKGARIDSLKNLPGGARYLRFYGINRNTTFGYSFFEFEAYGTENLNAEPVGTPVLGNNQNEQKLAQVFPSVLSQNGELNVNLPNVTGNEKIEVFNYAGAKVFSQSLSETQNRIALNNNIESGLYIVIIELGSKREVTKVIIK